MLSLRTDSATELATICSIVEIFMCRYSRMMKSSTSELVPASAFLSTCSRREFENNVGIYFLFFAAGREFHIYEESHAPGHGDVICRTTASVASASLLVSNVCVYIRDIIHFHSLHFLSNLLRDLLFYWMRDKLRHALSSFLYRHIIADRNLLIPFSDRIYCMILISLLSDRNHAEDRLNVPANVPG